MSQATADHHPVTRVPYRLEPFGERGWTVFETTDPYAAAAFVARHPDAAMPCWRRYKTITDERGSYLVMTP